jgi:hypothetical protein
MMKNQNLLYSPEKSFHLPIYAEQMASAFADFGCSKPKRRKDTYALNVLQFIDGSASEGRETSESSTNDDSATESTAT